MIINTPGEYTLQYTATDACGNSTTVERELTVEAPPRTVLYTDGTFIINELGEDRSANEALHGPALNEYSPFDPNGATNVDKYIFASSTDVPWSNILTRVASVEIGSEIHPTSTAYWFYNFTTCNAMDLSMLDTSAVTDMTSMFYYCQVLTTLDLTNFDTSNVIKMNEMFLSCFRLTELDLSNFDTRSVDDMGAMFQNCKAITTIYASSAFVVTQVTNSSNMFRLMTTNLVGGAGTIWNSYNPTDKTYAHIDGGTSDPGYFTARS